MDSIFEKLAKEEERFLNASFFAPVFTSKVRVKIANIVVDYKIDPPNYRGWGIFEVAGKNTAKFNRDANLAEIAAYLNGFDRTTFIVCDVEKIPLGISASEDKFFTTNLTPFFLADNISLFEHVYIRWDGSNFIFERKDNRSLVNATKMQEALQNKTRPNDLNFLGLTKFERIAYTAVYKIRAQKELMTTEGRIKNMLRRGGGQYGSHKRVGGNISVTYYVDGEKFTTTVSENLGVVSAGFCLTDHRTGRKYDTDHDLQTLVDVIREGQRTGQIVHW